MHVDVLKCIVCLYVSVCASATGCVIVLGAEVLPVYHGAASFLPHIFQPLEDYEVSVEPLLCILSLFLLIASLLRLDLDKNQKTN